MKNISETIFRCIYKLIIRKTWMFIEVPGNQGWDKKIVDELAFKINNNNRVLISNAIYNAISPISIDVTASELTKKLGIK